MKAIKEIISVLVILAVFKAKRCDAADPQNLPSFFSFEKNLETAYEQALNQLKPIMVIVHWKNCKACKKLRPKITGSSDVRKLSNELIMVHSLDGQDKLAEDIQLDGGNYFPRIVFIGSDGNPFEDITNPNQPQFRYYYTNEKDIAISMKEAIEANKRIIN